MEDNLNIFDTNPYIELAQRYEQVEKIKKEAEAMVYKYHDDFLKVFVPDDAQFDALLTEAKLLKNKKGSIKELDKVYYKMAMIYKRWIPIEQQLLAKNHLYKDLFKALKDLLVDIDNQATS